MRVPKGEYREKGTKKAFEEVLTTSIPYLMKNIDLQIQETQQAPSRINKQIDLR